MEQGIDEMSQVRFHADLVDLFCGGRVWDGEDVDPKVNRELDDDRNDEIDVDGCKHTEEDGHSMGFGYEGC